MRSLAGLSAWGARTELAEMDLESANWIVPVSPTDRPLFAMHWKGNLYFNTRLLFSLRLAHKIFSAAADALQWSMEWGGVLWVAHYLDDFITMGAAGSDECHLNLERMLLSCSRLGVLVVVQSKCEGPSMAIVFLGFLIDSREMTASLLEAMLQHTLNLVRPSSQYVANTCCVASCHIK